jgi:hypothetical protein
MAIANMDTRPLRNLNLFMIYSPSYFKVDLDSDLFTFLGEVNPEYGEKLHNILNEVT